MVFHRSYKININTMLDNASETHNVSIPIAAAITVYARIHMSQFKIILINIYIILIQIASILINLYQKI